jgi:hypothetical protein
VSQTQAAASVPASGRAGASGDRAGVALVVIAAAQLMVVLDAAIVYVALPHIQRAPDSPAPTVFVTAVVAIGTARIRHDTERSPGRTWQVSCGGVRARHGRR